MSASAGQSVGPSATAGSGPLPQTRLRSTSPTVSDCGCPSTGTTGSTPAARAWAASVNEPPLSSSPLPKCVCSGNGATCACAANCQCEACECCAQPDTTCHCSLTQPCTCGYGTRMQEEAVALPGKDVEDKAPSAEPAGEWGHTGLLSSFFDYASDCGCDACTQRTTAAHPAAG